MAKSSKNRGAKSTKTSQQTSTQNSVAPAPDSEVVSSGETDSQEQTPMTTEAVAETPAPTVPTLVRKKISQNGKNVLYAVPGRPGAARFSRSMFEGEAPETIELPGVNLVAAKEVKPVDPEKAAAREKAKAERVEKAKARAEKAAANAQKAADRLAKLTAPKGTKAPVAETAIDVPVAETASA